MANKGRKVAIDSTAIIQAMHEKRITNTELAKQLHICRATLWEMLKTGEAMPDLKMCAYSVLGITEKDEPIRTISGYFKGTVNGAKLEGYIEGECHNDSEL